MARRDLTFRVFVSSTFSDLKAERNALQGIAFPRLRAYCQEKGARFQAIDLRWGVSEEAALDQQTMNICLQELKHCQELSPRPNFIILLGERYGWRPLPPQIEASEFETLLERVPLNQQPLLLEWYKRDDNAVPPEYCLQPCKADVAATLTDQEKQVAHDALARQWNEQLEPFLHSLLVSAAQKVFPDEKDPRRQKYEDSATHQEIRYGALKAEDPQGHIFAYFRTIEGLPKDDSAKDYLDIMDGTADSEAHNRLKSLKEELGGDREHLGLLPPEHIYSYTAQWHDRQPQSDLKALCDRVESDLRRIIDRELATFKQTPETEREIKLHEEFGQQRAEHFIGRQEILEKIQAYIAGESNHPLVIHGVSGSGKTALIARAVRMAKGASPDRVSIFRFIGATPSSSDERSMLESLCLQIYETFNFEEQKHTLNLLAGIKDISEEARKRRQSIEEEYLVLSEYQELSTKFQGFLTKITTSRKLILFLDALDQLSDTDHSRSLSWLPDKLPKNVRLIVSCLPGECLSILQKRLPPENIVELKPMPPEEGEKLLDIWLNDAGRALQPNQRSEVLSKFQQYGLPLYLKLTFEECRLWKSYTEKVELSSDVLGIIRDLLRRFSLDANHGQMMVSRSLGYLAAARNGLTEDELLDVLSLDKEVISDFLHRSPKSPPVERLPVVVWSRLYFDLKPYLTERTADGTSLIAFYHPQFGKVVAEECLVGEVKKKRHQGLAEYFAEQSLWLGGDKKKNPNIRKVSEIPYQQTLGELWDEIEKTLCNLHFIEAKCAAGMTYGLVHDYYVALLNWPVERSNDRVNSFAKFFEERSHWIQYVKSKRLMSWYPVIFQEAYNHSSEGIVAKEAECKLNEGQAPKSLWLRRVNRHVSHSIEPKWSLIAESGYVTALYFHAIRHEVIAGTSSGLVIRLKTGTDEPFTHIIPNREAILSLAVTQNGTILAATRGKDHVSVWNIESGQLLKEEYVMTKWHKHLSNEVNAVISANGKELAFYENGEIEINGVFNGKEFIPPKNKKVCGIVVSPINNTGNIFDKYDFTGSCNISAIALSNSGRYLAMNCDGGTIVDLNDPAYPKNMKQLNLSHHIAFSRDDNFIVTSPYDKGVFQVWRISDLSLVATINQDRYGCRVISISPDSRYLCVGYRDGTIALWDLETFKLQSLYRAHSSSISAIAWDNDGQTLASGSDDGTIKAWGVNDLGHRQSGSSCEEVNNALLSTDGQFIAINYGYNYLMAAVDNAQVSIFRQSKFEDEAVAYLSGIFPITCMAFSADSSRIALGYEGGKLEIWGDAESSSSGMPFLYPIFRVEAFSKRVNSLCFSPNGEFIAAGGHDNGFAVRVWDIKDENKVGTFQVHEDEIKSVIFSPDGKLLASGGDLLDRKVKICQIDKANDVITLSQHDPHQGGIISLSFSPLGDYIYALCNGNIVRWNLHNRETTMLNCGDSIMKMSFSSDGMWMATQEEIGNICLWSLFPLALVAMFPCPLGCFDIRFVGEANQFVVVQRRNDLTKVDNVILEIVTP